MPYRLWTPDDVPLAERGNGGVWDVAGAQVAGGKVTAVPDLWGVRPLLQPTASLQPGYGAVGGYPAMIWPDAVNSLKIATAQAFQPAWYAGVMQFRDGTQLNTDNAICTLWGNDADTGNDRVRLRSQTGFLDSGITPSVNDGPASAAILPLPRSFVEFPFAYNAGQWGPSQSPSVNRGWRGSFFYVVALGAVPSRDIQTRFQGYLAHRFSFAAKLPAGHPYRAAPPTFYIQPQTATGSGRVGGLRGAGRARAIGKASGSGKIGGLAVTGLTRSIAGASGVGYIGAIIADGKARNIARAGGSGFVGGLTVEGRLRSIFLPRGRIATAAESRITSIGNSGRII